MTEKIFPILFVLVIPVLGLAQSADFDLDKALKDDNLDAVRKEANDYIEKHKGTPAAMFLRARLLEDGYSAVELYKKICSQFPESEVADDALFRTAQYYFSRGLYISARAKYLKLMESYPGSPFVGDASYFAAACLFASEKYAECQKELQDFISNYPNSELVDLAREDLKEINVDVQVPAQAIDQKPATKGNYTLQIGLFNQINLALQQRQFFSKSGLEVEIHEKRGRRGSKYLVWIGAFETKDAAEDFAKKFKKEYRTPYRIVERDK